MASTQEIQQKFLNYFRKNDYKFMKPCKVYNDDPSLFFVNSGMCQLKDVFLGHKGFDHTKIMNYQQCIRAGGKHNDIDEVGSDSYHLTCFTMLGNWTLGHIDKNLSIDLAYKFLIDECGLNPQNMYVTFFEGNGEIETDNETKESWLRYFPSDKVIASNFKDNFWTMGNEGPCGPCTEIHYDIIGNRDASKLVNQSDPTVIEIWNLVFIQYNLMCNKFVSLEKQYLDTGLGLERISMVIQNKNSVYQTDSFKYLFGYAQTLTNSDFYTDKFDNNKDKAYRIFVDHIRTIVISLYHNADFDCNKRGFILRKIFRRLLTNMYIHLNNYTIEQKFNNPIIACLITQILNFWLEYKHDSSIIHQKLIAEEKLYLGKISSMDKKYKKYLKKYKDIDIVIKKLKEECGIDYELIDNMDKLKFVH